jgi:hypothetical protein
MIYLCDNHSAVYAHVHAHPGPTSWVHIDAHCDMRGLYVDRLDALARSWKDVPMSASTWLSWLIQEGLVSEVVWVHDEVGGRAHDLNTVRYASDLRHFPYRLSRAPNGTGYPLALTERSFEGWRLDRRDVVLDVDWDFFADPRKPLVRREREVAQFLESTLTVVPQRVYCAYSPFYSVPDRARYERFVEQLSGVLDLSVEILPEPECPPHGLARALPMSVRTWVRRTALWAKKGLWMRNGLSRPD